MIISQVIATCVSFIVFPTLKNSTTSFKSIDITALAPICFTSSTILERGKYGDAKTSFKLFGANAAQYSFGEVSKSLNTFFSFVCSATAVCSCDLII